MSCIFFEGELKLKSENENRIIYTALVLSSITLLFLIYFYVDFYRSRIDSENIESLIEQLEKKNEMISDSANRLTENVNDLNTWMVYVKNDYLRREQFDPLFKNMTTELNSLNENFISLRNSFSNLYENNDNKSLNLLNEENELLPFYSFLPDAMGTEIGAYIPVQKNYSLFEKLNILASKLGKFVFKRKIEVERIVEKSNKKIAIINLQDTDKSSNKWNQAFQGSTGGGMTSAVLRKTFLQNDYKNKWIDGIEFQLNGKTFIDGDHTNLSGTILR